MGLAKNIFFFIGSIFAIIAFFKNVIEPKLIKNHSVWFDIKTKLCEDDLINLNYQISAARRINEELVEKLDRFVLDIENECEYLKLAVLGKQFNFHLKKFGLLFGELVNYIQTPYWKLVERTNDSGQVRYYSQLDREYFENKYDDPDAYIKNLKNASSIVKRMRVEYNVLSALANAQFIELLFLKSKIKKILQTPTLLG